MSAGVLILLAGAEPDQPLAWRRLSKRDGSELQRGVWGGGEPIQRRPGERVILVLPGADVQLRALDLPARTEEQARAAAALVLKSAIAGDGGGEFISVSEAFGATGRRVVAVLDGRRMSDWLLRCRDAVASPDEVHVDCAVWPTAPGRAAIAAWDNTVLVAAGEFGGFAIDASLAPPVVAPWLKTHAPTVSMVEVFGASPPDLAAALEQSGLSIVSRTDADLEGLLFRAAATPPLHSPNLRQGRFAPPRQVSTSWRIWRFAAALVFVLILLRVGLFVVDGWNDRARARETLAAAETVFRESRPDSGRIVNLRAQVTAALNAARPTETHPVIDASALIVAALAEHPDVRLEEMRHEAPGVRVTLILSAIDPDKLEAFAERLRQSAAGFEPGRMNAVDGRVQFVIQLEAR